MKRFLVLLFLLAAVNLSATVTIYIDPGTYTAGVSQTVLTTQIAVTLTGTPSNGQANRMTFGFPMTTSNNTTAQITIPSGVAGSCTGGSCNFITLTTSNFSSCDAHTPGIWPNDANGRVAVKMVGCADLSAAGTIQYITNAYPEGTTGGTQDTEGCQCFRGNTGPGPITLRNNDSFMSGNSFHMDDFGPSGGWTGEFTYKHNYWLYRNRFTPYWGGMLGSVDADGNDYGERQQTAEWKSGGEVTVEANFFKGNYNGSGTSTSSILVFRNENQGMQNVLLTDNIFEHIAGFFLPPDTNTSYAGTVPYGPTAGPFWVINNVAWDVNQKGPGTENAQAGTYDIRDARNAGYGGYNPTNSVNAGSGWLVQGPNLGEGLYFAHNTFPDGRGRIPTLDYTANQPNGGLVMRKNFLSVSNLNLAQGIGARGGDSGLPSGCAGSGWNALTCAFPSNFDISGNVLTSPDLTTQQIQTDGWSGNTVLGNTALASIWPKYNLNSCGAVAFWHCDLDPEMFRLPAGSSYAGIGADITHLKAAMGWIDNPSAAFDKNNNLVVAWLDNDVLGQACTVDVGTPGHLYDGTFYRSKLDTGGNKSRSVTIPASHFSPATVYQVRLNCETAQGVLPFLTAKSN